MHDPVTGDACGLNVPSIAPFLELSAFPVEWFPRPRWGIWSGARTAACDRAYRRRRSARSNPNSRQAAINALMQVMPRLSLEEAALDIGAG